LIADRVDRWVVVTGGPGMGKSALLAAWLARREAAGAVVPHHFIRRGAYDWDDPAKLVGLLVAQIEARFPEQRELDPDPRMHPAARLEAALRRVASQPAVKWARKGQLYGPPEWQSELRESRSTTMEKGSTPRAAVFVAGTLASSDRLVKDPDLVISWLATSRDLLAVEIESGGVYRASQERCPMLTIRGISDIMGLKRAEAWTKYACASAAAFTRAFLHTRPVPVGASLSDPP
jgi:hypothetical protein